MKIFKNLYVSENIKNKDEIISLLSNDIDVFGVYLICTLAENKNIFEIFESKYLFKEFNKNKEWVIVGISSSKQDAIQLVERIFKENISENMLDFKKNFLK